MKKRKPLIDKNSPKIKMSPAVNVYMTEDETIDMLANATINEKLREYAIKVNEKDD